MEIKEQIAKGIENCLGTIVIMAEMIEGLSIDGEVIKLGDRGEVQVSRDSKGEYRISGDLMYNKNGKRYSIDLMCEGR